MLKYKNILLATDLSKFSHIVAEKAAEVAKLSQAKLSVVHVMEHSPVSYGGEFSIPIDVNLEQSLENHARKALANLAKAFLA